MSWSGIADNQCVSFDNLRDAVTNGVFTALTTIPTGNKQITKSDASTYVNVYTSYAPFAAKSSNQLVVKSDLVEGFTIYGAGYGCVVPETDVLIAPEITRKAGSFQVGDTVYTQHETTKIWGYYKVAALERKEQPILNISTDKGDIRCSTTHLLFRRGEFVKAEELIVGDIISHIEGDAIITDIVSEDVSTVIDFTIEEAHTYVAAGFIAHNKCSLYGWNSCGDACTGGATAYTTQVAYLGSLGIGTVLTNLGACYLSTPYFYYYSGGYLEIIYTGGHYEVASLSTCPCAIYVDIDSYVPNFMYPYTNYTFAANSATYALDTNLDVEISWTGDLGGVVIGTVTIPSSTQCNSTTVYSGSAIYYPYGENISTVSVNLDPSSYGSQIYQVGTLTSSGYYPC